MVAQAAFAGQLPVVLAQDVAAPSAFTVSEKDDNGCLCQSSLATKLLRIEPRVYLVFYGVLNFTYLYKIQFHLHFMLFLLDL